MAKKRLDLYCTTALIAVSVPMVCHAQNEVAASSGSRPVLEEVVVTAEKRESLAQNTAIALSAISGDNLVKNGVDSLTDIASIAPNVSFGQQIDQTIIVIRG